jgi:hypothetical protein
MIDSEPLGTKNLHGDSSPRHAHRGKLRTGARAARVMMASR